jgi:addiction module HigA family antidote
MARARTRRPVHPGEVLKVDVLDELGVTVTTAARHLDVPRSRLAALVAGRAPCTADLAQRIARATGTSVQSWLSMQIALDVWNAEHHPPADIEGIAPLWAGGPAEPSADD